MRPRAPSVQARGPARSRRRAGARPAPAAGRPGTRWEGPACPLPVLPVVYTARPGNHSHPLQGSVALFCRDQPWEKLSGWAEPRSRLGCVCWRQRGDPEPGEHCTEGRQAPQVQRGRPGRGAAAALGRSPSIRELLASTWDLSGPENSASISGDPVPWDTAASAGPLGGFLRFPHLRESPKPAPLLDDRTQSCLGLPSLPRLCRSWAWVRRFWTIRGQGAGAAVLGSGSGGPLMGPQWSWSEDWKVCGVLAEPHGPSPSMGQPL